DKKAEALELIADAREEIAELKMTEWYISTRTSLSGYGNIKTDAGCIEAIGNAFPIIFLTIAILISLTTITRMVEEDRGLIGTYKALGFTDSEIRRKYLIYALLACLFGGILGDLMGFVLLPNIIFIIFGVMYQIPAYSLTFNYFYGIGGIVLFIIGIAGASIVSCEAELSHMPAMLMRPKAPRNGSRVFLERITPVWSRLSFLNKVTARNLFRYKKRLFMTLFGIAGCTALLICGFTIKDTVTGLMPRQYEDTYQYDIMAVAEDNDKLLEYLEDNNAVRKYMNTLITNVKLINEEGKEETVQLIVLPDGMSMKSYIRLYNKAGDNLTLSEEDVFATINVSKVLGFEKEDMITIQNLQLELADVEITEIAMNYLGNNVYMTQAKYEELFGTFEPNGALILLRGEEEEQEAFAQELAEKDGMLSAISTSSLKEDFEPAFQIINLVVYVVIVLAAALAFVVLFTLATTNISERERELATIKVLGFFDNEVHAYVNKETLILTGLGILCGLPAGNLLGTWLMSILNLPSIYFATTIYPISYVISGVIAICFALIVNTITDRSLNKINPVEALKSVE
ncbi:MAG: ABC transporter permease, partial [Lachnospiraceae bacterium]|nr:ABC transporter permease [Lachnospiraceae bacterium]